MRRVALPGAGSGSQWWGISRISKARSNSILPGGKRASSAKKLEETNSTFKNVTRQVSVSKRMPSKWSPRRVVESPEVPPLEANFRHAIVW